jgi:hypothetical protein
MGNVRTISVVSLLNWVPSAGTLKPTLKKSKASHIHASQPTQKNAHCRQVSRLKSGMRLLVWPGGGGDGRRRGIKNMVMNPP